MYVSIIDDTKKRFHAACAIRGLTMSQVVAELIEQWLKINEAHPSELSDKVQEAPKLHAKVMMKQVWRFYRTMVWTKNQPLNNGKYTISDDVPFKKGDFINRYIASDSNGENVIIETLDGNYFLDLGSQSPEERKKIEYGFREKGIKLSRCRNIYIASYREPFQEGEIWCIPIEYVQGDNLDTLPRLEQEEGSKYIKQLCQGLKEVHKHQIFHLNINPENIIKRHDREEIVLTGFNLIKGERRTTTIPPREKYAEFYPIELFGHNHAVNQQSDIYSLAAILYFLLTKKSIPLATDRAATDRAATDRTLSSDLSIQNGIDANTCNAIKRGLSLYQKERPPSVQEWVNLLEQKSNRFTLLKLIPTWNSLDFQQKIALGGLAIAFLAALGTILQGLGAWKDKQDINSSPTPSQVSTPPPTNSSNK
ncbi:MAG: plasmid partition protein ParG [Nostoc sp.]|uniref:plasmid partition protein ParG n=1 Tax=Nostoc sp. TaxID=1180 RepID=UPI002FF9824C